MKPRGDSVLKTLDDERQELLFAQLQTGTYKDVKTWVLREWGIKTSETALGEYWQWASINKRVERADSMANQLTERLRELQPTMSDEALKTVGQMLFMEQTLAAGDVNGWVKVRGLELKEKGMAGKFKIEAEKLAQAERKLALLEQKAAAATATLADGALGVEERHQKLKEIFGMG